MQLNEYLTKHIDDIKVHERLWYKPLVGMYFDDHVRGVILCASDIHEFQEEFRKYEYRSYVDSRYYNVYDNIKYNFDDNPKYFAFEYLIDQDAMNFVATDDYQQLEEYKNSRNYKARNGSISDIVKYLRAGTALKYKG